ncbi:FAD binding domain-containing protein [Azorhizobium doebereinerae]|uniref:FAD binding domain-containing protein n=1 Tax=Azorhizobium doebereinerae TaxID=281091 RepID=UPI0003F7AE2C|nr:FAD binding domain-containing protein [Azorhizobium doebereinerae]
MKPAPFALERPRTTADALAFLAAGGRVMAGGQSLGPMLNLRLAAPGRVVDVSAADLRTAAREGETLVLGACVTHADIEDGRIAQAAGPVLAALLARVAGGIAYRAVRNRGTIGGSLCHADPAADWVNALSALDASVEIATPSGSRRLPLGDFLTGALATALGPDELLAAVRIPQPAATAGFGYVKHCRKVGEFAHAIGAALIDPARGAARLVMGALERPPLLIADARALFGGAVDADFAARFDPEPADAALQAAGIADPVSRHVHVEVLRRAVMQAAGLQAGRAAA